MATQTENLPAGGTVVQNWMPVQLAEQLRAEAQLERRSISSLIRLGSKTGWHAPGEERDDS